MDPFRRMKQLRSMLPGRSNVKKGEEAAKYQQGRSAGESSNSTRSATSVAIDADSEANRLEHVENSRKYVGRKIAILCETKRKTREGRKLPPADKEFLEKMKGECSDLYEMNLLEEILGCAEMAALEGYPPLLHPREKDELEELKMRAKELKHEAKFLMRRTNLLHLIFSDPVKLEAEKGSQLRCQGRGNFEYSMLDRKSAHSTFSSIKQHIRNFEASISDKYYGRCSGESPDDIDREIQQMFLDVKEQLAEYDSDLAVYLPQDMVENMKGDPPDAAMDCSTEPIERTLPPTSTKCENAMRPDEDEMLRAPEAIRKLAIEAAVNQISSYFMDERYGKIGISGCCWEEVTKALKAQPTIRHMFKDVLCISLTSQQSIIELQMKIAEMECKPPIISWENPLLLLVDYVDQLVDLNDLDFASNACVVLNIQSQELNEVMAVDLEIRMEDHLLPWKLFCKNVGQVLDHPSPLQEKAVQLIQECRGHLLAIVLLSTALKDVTDVRVWELALHELMWQPSSLVEGMSVTMVNVLRFIWERMRTPTRNCIKYCLLNGNGKEFNKSLLIYHGIKNGWLPARDEGEKFLEELNNSFLLENVGEDSVRVREEIRLVLLNIFLPGKDPAYLRLGDLGLTETPEAKKWVAKEINLMNNKLSELPESPICPFLVNFFLQGNYDLMVIPPLFFERMPLLQVLDLSYTSIKSLPPSISKLVTLREFYLRGCDLLMELPPQLGALRNLEVFDLEGTEIMHLPKEIGELISLKRLKVTINGYANLYKEKKNVKTIIPRMALSNLSQLNELSIDVHPDGDWWDVEVKAIINELCSLKNLRILKLYLPVVELLKDLQRNITSLRCPALTHFRFIVGRHEQRFISRLPCEVQEEFNNLEKLKKGLKYINGEGTPTEIVKELKHANAFFLDRHWTIRHLSDFGTENMDKLKFCLLAECSQLQSVIDRGELNQEEYDSDFNKSDHDNESDHDSNFIEEIVHDSDFSEEIVLGSLQYLSIHYMKKMDSICTGPVGVGCLKNLKSLVLHRCPSLLTIFTPSMLGNLISLKEVIVESCPKIKSLVSEECFSVKSSDFLPNLKKISLLELPELFSISNSFHIAPKLERLVVFYCPKLERLSVMEVSSKSLKVIKGESEWWDSLKWRDSGLSRVQQDYLAGIFIPLRRNGDLTNQLAED